MNYVTEYKKAEEILREFNYDMPVNYSKFKMLDRPVILNNVQKKLLEYISKGKIISCPRCMGKSYVIKIYTEWLNWKMDTISHSEADEIITMDECINDGMYNKELLKELIERNLLNAIQEYNIDLKTLDILQKEIEQEKEFEDKEIETFKNSNTAIQGKIYF